MIQIKNETDEGQLVNIEKKNGFFVLTSTHVHFEGDIEAFVSADHGLMPAGTPAPGKNQDWFLAEFIPMLVTAGLIKETSLACKCEESEEGRAVMCYIVHPNYQSDYDENKGPYRSLLSDPPSCLEHDQVLAFPIKVDCGLIYGVESAGYLRPKPKNWKYTHWAPIDKRSFVPIEEEIDTDGLYAVLLFKPGAARGETGKYIVSNCVYAKTPAARKAGYSMWAPFPLAPDHKAVAHEVSLYGETQGQ